MQDVCSDILATMFGDISLRSIGTGDVYTTGPLAAENIRFASNTGKMISVSSAVIVLEDLIIRSEGGGELYATSIVQVCIQYVPYRLTMLHLQSSHTNTQTRSRSRTPLLRIPKSTAQLCV